MKILIDIGDLIAYLSKHSSVSGIQRVVIEVWIDLNSRPEIELYPVAFSEEKQAFLTVNSGQFEKLLESLTTGASASTVNGIAESMNSTLFSSKVYEVDGSENFLLLGAAWIHHGYFPCLMMMKKKGVKVTSLVYDLIPVLDPTFPEPGRLQFTRYIYQLLYVSDSISCISSATRSDLLKFAESNAISCPPSYVTKLPGGIDFSKLDPEEGEKPAALGISSDYVLCVGTIETRKNHLSLARAWIALIEELGINKVPDLVCVGRLGWEIEPLLTLWFENADLRKKMHFLHEGLNDLTLRRLYEGCSFTVYPSLFEGWGLPVSESLDCGKAVIASSSSSIPEAGENFADYFDPGVEAELYALLKSWILDPHIIAQREELILSKRKSLTWAEVSDVLLQSIKDVPNASADSALPEVPLDVEIGLGRLLPFPSDSAGETFYHRMSAQRVLPATGKVIDLANQSLISLCLNVENQIETSSPYGLNISGLKKSKIEFRSGTRVSAPLLLYLVSDPESAPFEVNSNHENHKQSVLVQPGELVLIPVSIDGNNDLLVFDLFVNPKSSSGSLKNVVIRSIMISSAPEPSATIFDSMKAESRKRNTQSQGSRKVNLAIAAENEVDRVYSSYSWRLTKPLRRAHKFARVAKYRLTKP